jgi:hypothetical protein
LRIVWAFNLMNRIARSSLSQPAITLVILILCWIGLKTLLRITRTF